MVQTYFPVADESDFDSAITAISSGGTDAAINTSYTIALTTLPIGLTNDVTLDLETGSTLLLNGAALNATGVSFDATGAVTLDLNFTGTITLDGGSVDNVALTTNSGGTVIAGYYAGQIVGTVGDGGDTAVNDGTIMFSGAKGAIDFDAGLVQNGWDGTTAALISGAAIGVEIDTSGTVQNAGTISAFLPPGDTGVGVYLGAGTVDNGTAAHDTALITADDFGVEIIGVGLVGNDGTISGTYGAGVYLGSGTIDNGGSADTAASITSTYGDAVWVNDGTAIVANLGTISASDGVAVYLASGGTLTNGSTSDTAALVTGAYEGVLVGQAGSAFAGTVDNYGTIAANGDDTINAVIGVFLENGGSVANLGTASAIEGVDWGVLAEGAPSSVQNDGSIVASGVFGFGVDLAAGGTVDNGMAAGSAATIRGTYDGVRIEGGAAGAGALVDNDGTIIGSVGVDFASGAVEAAGTVINDGLIESTSSSGDAIVFGDGNERLILQAGGAFVGSVQGYEAALPAATTTIEFAAGTNGTFAWNGDDSGNVTDTAGSFTFAAIGTFAIDAGASWTLRTNATSAQTITFQHGASPAVLGLSAPTAGTPNAVQAVIEDFGAGGTIDLTNIANAAVTGFRYAGSTLDVLGGSGTLAVLDLPGPFFTNSFTHGVDATTGTFITTDVLPCFVAGTAIRTLRGEVRVEDLREGDRVICAGGGVRPIVWIGHRRVDVARHPSPEAMAPVRVRRDAFAEGAPLRDLWLSPDHAVFVDDMLIPIRQLLNGASIAQVAVDRVTYFHVELDRHDVLFADGLPAESYLDTGNRCAFANADVPMALYPDFERPRAADGGMTVTVEADQVEPVWRRVAARAEAAGHRVSLPVTTADPALWLLADGETVRPAEIIGNRYVFVLRPRTNTVRLASRSVMPSTLRPWLDDRRRLGVAVRRIVLRDQAGRTEIPVDHPAVGDGWHAVERSGDLLWRWTDGSALLPVPPGTAMVELEVAPGGAYLDLDAAAVQPEQAAA